MPMRRDRDNTHLISIYIERGITLSLYSHYSYSNGSSSSALLSPTKRLF